MVIEPIDNITTTSDESSLLTSRIRIQGNPTFDYYSCKPNIKKRQKM
jgi:hypothetical protein